VKCANEDVNAQKMCRELGGD